MAQAFFPNVATIATRALTDIAAVDPEGGVTPTTAQLTDVMQIMNFIATSWIAHGMQVWCQKSGTYTLSAGVGSPTVGVGGTIAIARPEVITQVWLRDTTQTYPMDIPLNMVGREEYNRLSQKTVPGVPNTVYYDPQYDLPAANSGATAKGVLNMWPVPDAATATQYDLYFIYTRPLQDFTATADALDFPQEWYDAIRWAVADSLCPSYNVPVTKWDRIRSKADKALALALSFDRESDSVTMSPAQEAGQQ